MFVRLLLAAVMSPLGREFIIDLYKKYVRTTSRPYIRKD